MARQLQQERRGGVHARPGPPARPRPQGPDEPTPTPAHRAPASGRHTGTRARPAARSTLPRNVGLFVAAVALAGATAFWLQDLREPADGSATRPAAAPADDAATTPSVAPAPGALPTAGASTDPADGSVLEPTPDVAVPDGALPDGAAGDGTAGDGTAGDGTAGDGVAVQVPDLSAVVAAATGPDRTPAALRTALEQVLRARASATTTLLRGVVTGELAGAGATSAGAAVDATGRDLETLVAAWGDPGVAAQLREASDLQVIAAWAYASAVRDDDDAEADQARAELGATSRVLGGLLEQLTTGAVTRFVPPEDAARMRDYVDAQAVGDTATAADLEAWLTARTGREGAAIATALAGPA